MNIPLSKDRLLRYVSSSFDKNKKWELTLDKMLGIPLDMLALDQYVKPDSVESGQILPEDQLLLYQQKQHRGPTRQQLFQQGSSNWLKRVEYMSNNLWESSNTQVALSDTRKAEIEKVSRMKQETAESREQQMTAIERTFEEALSTPVHPLHKDWKPVEVLPLFPQEINYDYKWTQYDYAPIEIKPEQGEQTEQAEQQSAEHILK